MIPRFYRQSGLQVAGNGLAGYGARSEAEVGTAIAGLGATVGSAAQALAAERRRAAGLAMLRGANALDEFRLSGMAGYGQRREQLRATTVDGETGRMVTGYQQEIQHFPDRLNDEFERLATTMSDAAREEFEAYYLKNAPQWAADVVQLLDTLELDDVVKESRDMTQDGRSAEALALLSLYKDRFSAEQYDRLVGETQIAGARTDLQQIAELDGWDAARRQLAEPAWQKLRGLDTAEASTIYNSLRSFVADEAAIAARREQATLDATAMTTIDQAHAGTLDLQAAQNMVLSGTLERTVYEQARKIMTSPPDQNDPEASAQSHQIVADVQAGRITAREGLNQLNAISSQLTPTARDARIADITDTSVVGAALRDAGSRARRELVTMTDNALTWGDLMLTDEQLKQQARNERVTQERLLNYHDAQLRQWHRDHPDASEEDVYAESAGILARLRTKTDSERQSLLQAWDAQTIGLEVTVPFAGSFTLGGPQTPEPGNVAPGTPQEPQPGPGAPMQMRLDTPPELRARIQKLLAARVPWSEIAAADEVRPYLIEVQP